MGAGNWTAHFNMDDTYFHDNLVPNSVIGFYDGRMVAQRGTPLAADDDPSTTMYNDSFASTIVSYLSDLHYTTPSTYTMSSNAINVWNFSHGGMNFPDTIPDLAAAMAMNPKLKVFSANGYHDLVTPFYNTEGDLAPLGRQPQHRDPLLPGRPHDLPGRHRAHAGEGRPRGLLCEHGVDEGGCLASMPAAPVVAVVETAQPTGQIPGAVFETKLRDPALPGVAARRDADAALAGDALRS